MRGKTLSELASSAFKEHRRLVAPLAGFPGVEMIGSTIKLAQQNFGEHYKAIRSLVDSYSPDLVFPLMDLSVEANALGRYTVFPRGESATVPKDTFDMEDLESLSKINITFDTRLMGYVETIKMMSVSLPPSILRGAYVVGPFTLAALMMGADEAVYRQSSTRKSCTDCVTSPRSASRNTSSCFSLQARTSFAYLSQPQ